MILFARVVDRGSISAAAREINQSPSAVSKQVSALEDRLGVRLLTRTQQGISLTEEGKLFHGRCAEIADTVLDAQSLVESLATHPKGMLKVSSTVAFGKAQILPLLPEFLSRYPDVSVNMVFTDRPSDPFSQDIDVGIRFSEQIDNDAVIARKLAPNRRVVCATPDYVTRFGKPLVPLDLQDHNCLRLSTVKKWNEWTFGKEPGARKVLVTGNFEATSADAVYYATLAGLGIARLSTYLVGEDLAEGRLVQLLPEYAHSESAIYAIYPERRNLAPKIRAFLDFLTNHFGKTPPWERAKAV